MLRISETIELVLRKKHTPLSKELLKGLFLSFAIHLMLFYLFRIVSLNDLNNPITLPFIAVEVDLSKEELIDLQAMDNSSFSLHLPQSCYQLDDFQMASILQSKKAPFILKKRAFESPSFTECEKIEYHPLSTIVEEEDDQRR